MILLVQGVVFAYGSIELVGTAALNAGLYSTGHILRSMAAAGSASRFALRMNKSGVPYGGIAITAAISLLGVPLNYLVPGDAFEIVLGVAAVGLLVYAGINVEREGLFSGTRGQQIAGRFSLIATQLPAPPPRHAPREATGRSSPASSPQ